MSNKTSLLRCYLDTDHIRGVDTSGNPKPTCFAVSAFEAIPGDSGDPCGAAGWALGDLVFPDADDSPAQSLEFGVDPLVAGHVAVDFLVPVGAVGCGSSAVLGAAVPEAAVDEDGDARLDEDDVGFAGELFAEAVSEASLVEGAAEAQFARGVGAFDTPHGFRALRR